MVSHGNHANSLEEGVIRVRRGSYNSLMHAVHRECAKETHPPNMHTARKARKKYSERNAGFQPISIPIGFVPFPPRSQSPRVIVNKLLKKQKHPENRKTK
jgi:hypothetical protein